MYAFLLIISIGGNVNMHRRLQRRQQQGDERRGCGRVKAVDNIGLKSQPALRT